MGKNISFEGMYERFLNGEARRVCREIGRMYPGNFSSRKLDGDLSSIKKKNLEVNFAEFERGESNKFYTKTEKIGDIVLGGEKWGIIRKLRFYPHMGILEYGFLGEKNEPMRDTSFSWEIPGEKDRWRGFLFPKNDHREVHENYRGYGLSKLIFGLAEELFSSGGEERVGIITEYPGTASFAFHLGYYPEKPERVDFESFLKIIQKPNLYESELNCELKLMKDI